MAFVRPRVEIFQEFKDVVVSPVAPEFKTCLVGPCFYIQDYKTNKTSLEVGTFIKPGMTNPALCSSTGTSSGRPDAGPFLTLSEPPNFRAGAALDSASVNCYFDDAYIEIAYGSAGAIATGSNVLTVDNTVNLANVKAGDRVILHKPNATAPMIAYVKSVDADNSKIILTSIRKASDPLQDANNLWRVEHKIDDYLIDSSALSFDDNSITITVPSAGIRAVYNDQLFLVNYAKIYIEYRALITDLASLTTINTIDEIVTKLGNIDSRNPLAVAAYVALSNTNTPIYAFCVTSDNLAGHTAARNYLSSVSDIYAIVPITDSLQLSDWLSVINMWKQNCEALALPEKSTYRIVVGSLHELPVYKNSVNPSVVGSTEADPADPVDVFVCADSTVDFSAVTSKHLLDVNGSSVKTIPAANATMFADGAAAKTLRGAIGRKRVRINENFGTLETSETTDFFVRNPITVSEGGTALLKNITATVSTGSGDAVTLQANEFSGVVSAGDIVQVVSGSLAKEGYSVASVAGDVITLKYTNASASGSVVVHVYRSAFGSTGVFAASGGRVYVETATAPSGISANDLLVVFKVDGTSPVNSNAGIFAVTEVSGNKIYIRTHRTLATGATVFGVACYKAVHSRGNVPGVMRRRLVYLKDLTARFTETVAVGEYIEIPYPANASGLSWDTTVNRWPIADIVANEILKAQLSPLQELAPKNYVAGFSGDCPYRIAIGLDKDKQVEELNRIVASYKSMRLVMCWPYEVRISGVYNARTGEQPYLRGQYLAAAVGAQIAGNPPHQGFTYLPITSVTSINGSSFYFTDDQLTLLRNGGWYVFVQDSDVSAPYCIHEVTTDVSAYEFGELMHVKVFDYVSKEFKAVLEEFKGRYNITPETLELIRASLMHRAEYLQNRRLPKIGAPLLSAKLGLLAQTEADRLEIYMEISLPHVLNQLGLHLQV